MINIFPLQYTWIKKWLEIIGCAERGSEADASCIEQFN